MNDIWTPEFKVERAALTEVIAAEMKGEGIPRHHRFLELQASLDAARTPLEIAEGRTRMETSAVELCGFYGRLAEKVVRKADEIIAKRESDTGPTLDSLRDRKSGLSTQADDSLKRIVAGYGLSTVGAIAVDVVTTGGLVTLGTWFFGMVMGGEAISSGSKLDSKIKEIEAEMSRLQGSVSWERTCKDRDVKLFSSRADVLTAQPRAALLRCWHGTEIHEAVQKCTAAHAVTPDAVMEYLAGSDAAGGEMAALLALLKADYRLGDLDLLREYGRTAEISEHRAQHALLQFINHTLAAHQDHFEIWASKLQDLAGAFAEMKAACVKQDPKVNRPLLEILREKPVSLGGKLSVQTVTPAQATYSDGTNAISLRQAEADEQMNVMKKIMSDASLPLRERHDRLCTVAVEQMEEFIHHFGRVAQKLDEVEKQLERLTGQKDRLTLVWERAKSISDNLEILRVSHPSKRANERRLINFKSIGVGVLIDAAMSLLLFPSGVATAEAISKFVSGEIHNRGTKMIAESEYTIKLAGLEERSRLTPEEMRRLTADLKEAEDLCKKLAHDKEFLQFLSNNRTLQTIKAAYLLLPRLVAAENTLGVFLPRMEKAGYKGTPDEFLSDARARHPRLAQAWENFLLGLGNSNDLKVILEEANAIEEPQTPLEQLLFTYTEEVIKKHYGDFAKQASVIDYLEMRHVIVTPRHFHAANEIVKWGTEAPLETLLGSTGDFSLTGDRNLQEIFGYHQTLRGSRHFQDTHAPHDSGVMALGRVQASDPGEIAAKNEMAGSFRCAETRIPRLKNGVLVELSVHEYLLTQGFNVVRNHSLAGTPHALGAMVMVNEVTRMLMQKLGLEAARGPRSAASGEHGVGLQLERLLAGTFVDFFSELGALHSADPEVLNLIRKVKTAFSGENFGLATDAYETCVREKALGRLDLFVQIHFRNLENYLSRASRGDRKALLSQLNAVADTMQLLQPTADFVMPGTEKARRAAHCRNHLLSNVGISPSTWELRAKGIRAA